MKYLLIILIFVIGCGPGEPQVMLCENCGTELVPKPMPEVVQLPPEFHHGDRVTVTNSDQVGIVTSFNYYKNVWTYTIMIHSGETLKYKQSDLRLVQRFLWGSEAWKASELSPKAEIESGIELEVFE